jgi:hypothetical protein
MLAKVVALGCIVAAAAVTATADANHGATRQRVAIEHKGASFVLTPLTSGSVKPDAGPISFCCWTERQTMRNGQTVDIDDPQMTLTGKWGTLVVRNRIGYVDVPDGWSIFTGTWKVIRGTGQYAGLVGGGGAAGISTPSDNTSARFEGFLSPR